MKKNKLAAKLILCLLIELPVHAEDATRHRSLAEPIHNLVKQQFLCEGTNVKIYLRDICKDINFYRSKEVVFSATSSTKDYQVVFDGNYYLGASCQRTSSHKGLVVFQAYCDGNDISCYPDANFGIIDPKSMKVLLSPSHSSQNIRRASEILGYKPKLIEVVSSRQPFKSSVKQSDYPACS